MKNRAKCKLCCSIIESMHPTDIVFCTCGHIGVEGGDSMKCTAIDWNNFLRVDDEGNEFVVKVLENTLTNTPELHDKRKVILDSIENLIDTIDGLPGHAQRSHVTQSDLSSVLSLLLSLFKLEERKESS